MPKQMHLALDVSRTRVETAWPMPGSWVGRHYPDIGLFEDIAPDRRAQVVPGDRQPRGVHARPFAMRPARSAALHRRSGARIAAARPLPHRLYRPRLARKSGRLSSAGRQSTRTGLDHSVARDPYRCSQKRAVASHDLAVEQHELARRMSGDSFGDGAGGDREEIGRAADRNAGAAPSPTIAIFPSAMPISTRRLSARRQLVRNTSTVVIAPFLASHWRFAERR